MNQFANFANFTGTKMVNIYPHFVLHFAVKVYAKNTCCRTLPNNEQNVQGSDTTAAQ